MFRLAGITTSLEPVLKPLAAGQEDKKRPWSRGDILWTTEEITVGDVSVIHPAADSYVEAAAKTAGSAAKHRDATKRHRYELGDAAGYAFVPLTSETFGRLGKPAMDVLNKVAMVAATKGRVDKARFMQTALKTLSVALCKGNHLIFNRANDVYVEAFGEECVAGDVVPTDEAE